MRITSAESKEVMPPQGTAYRREKERACASRVPHQEDQGKDGKRGASGMFVEGASWDRRACVMDLLRHPRPEGDEWKHRRLLVLGGQDYSESEFGERAGFFRGVTSLSPSSDFEVECSRFLWRP